jgi:hypothetical protein
MLEFAKKYSDEYSSYTHKITKNVSIYYDNAKPIDIELIINDNLNDLADVNILWNITIIC